MLAWITPVKSEVRDGSRLEIYGEANAMSNSGRLSAEIK